MSSAADRNLLFGILALQMDFVSREQLIAAVSAWVLEKATPLGAILVRQQALADDRRTLLEALVTEHLKQHGNDPERSLAAVSSIESVRDQLKQLADPEIEASLIHVSRDRDRTDPLATLTVGESTSVGQRFRILRPHAKGGLGEVFVASDEELRREVALKQIQPAHADEPNSRLRFLLEAEITGGLEHPGIVPVYGLGTYADGRPFYAMRFIRGDSLKDAIDRFHSSEAAKVDQGERTLQFRKLLGRFIDVCNAIEYAHSRGVLHRDLKPGNIMLGKYGETLVVDWGLAKAVGRSETSNIESDERTLRPSSGSGSAPTQMGSTIGTPQYMSPEQAAGRLDLLGPHSDVYSLGATLYCVLCGRSPLSELRDLGEIRRRVQRGEIPPPSSLPVITSKASIAIPKALEAICLKAMSLKPVDRYASPRQLADDLEHWLADEPVRASPDSLPQRVARWTRRHRALVQTLTAALILLSIVASAAAVLVNEQRQAAENARRQAVQLAADNFDLAQKERAERERANRNQYIALINSAQQAWASGNIAQCVDFLKRLSPLANQPGLAGFEYSYLNSICNDRQRGLELDGHSQSVLSLALAQLKDRSVLLSGGVDGKLIVWDPIEGKPIRILSEKLDSGPGAAKDKMVRGVRAAALTSDGTLAACVTRTQVQIWNVNSGTPIRIINKISGDTFGLSFAGNDEFLAVPGRRIDPSDHLEKSAISWYRAVDDRDDNIEPTFLDVGQNITALALTADGLTLAVAAGPAIGRQEVRFFDMRDRKERPRLPTEHKAVILALAYSRDGNRFATGSADGTINIWNLRDTTVTASLIGHRGFVTAVRFSRDGKRCFSAGADQTVREWDLTTNRLSATYRGHRDIVTSLLLLPTPDGDKLITASGDHTIRIWPPDPSPYRTVNVTPAPSAGNWVASLPKPSEFIYQTIAARFTNEGSPRLVTSVSLAPDRSRLAAVVLAGGRGAVVLRSLNKPKNDLRLLDTQRPGQSYACATLSPDGRLLFAGEGNFMKVFVLRTTDQLAEPNPSQVVVWDLNENRVVARKQGPNYDIFSLAISTSGEKHVTGDVGGGVHVWTASKEKSRELFRGRGLPVVDVRFSNDERYVAGAFAFDGFVRIWEVESGREVASLEKMDFPTAVAFSPDGTRLAVGTGSALADRARAYGHITVWDWRGPKLLDTLKGHTQFIRRVAYSADGKRLWSVGFDGASRLWDVETGNEFLKLEGNFHYGFSGDLSRDDKCIAVGTEAGEAVLWSADR